MYLLNFIFLSPSFSLPPSHFLLSQQEECTEQMNQKGAAYIGQMSRLMFYLNAIGPISTEKVDVSGGRKENVFFIIFINIF